MEYGTFEVWVSKIEETFAVNFDTLSKDMRRGVIAYGLKQLFNDKTGGKNVTVAEARATALKCLDALRVGTYGFASNGGKRVDPVEAECQAIFATALAKKPGVTMTAAKVAAKTWRTGAKAELIAKVEAKAKANVAARDFDLDI